VLHHGVVTEPIVLVHGGAHGAWCWEPLLPHIDAHALAVDLPPRAVRGVPNPRAAPDELATMTIDDFVVSTIRDIDAAGFDRFVLVGHSMGGLTIAEIARRISQRVAHLVFVSCMVPPEGGLVLDGVPSDSQSRARNLVDNATSGAQGGAGLDEATIRFMFCNDMDDDQTRFVLEHTGPEALGVFGERVSRVGIPPTLPKTYVRLLRDQALPPGDQDRAIANLRESPGGPLNVVELDTGHDVMVSSPTALARVIEQIALN
jgi:pimeloyl-ACP methyl ester carboxylesterase